ncbi:MAG: glycoside hydrolase family 15 protein, partial [Alphaproteobacteria bacterium]|nr:glycoside hydrolase family 15 protein [Alphaproteobacteria bacterium]
RQVTGLSGRVAMRSDMALRFHYGRLAPWVRRHDGALTAIAGPDAVHVHAPMPMEADNRLARADFTVARGETVAFVMAWHPSQDAYTGRLDPDAGLAATLDWWTRWASQYRGASRWRDPVVRSLITLKALTYGPTGGIVAAPTTSLPEKIGGVRNWDYRFCWLRDATFTLYSLMTSGFVDEAHAWREWLLRAVAGEPRELQALYGVAGEPMMPEWRVPWLAGYEGSAPVRVGNEARCQRQLDVFGEMMDAFHVGRAMDLDPQPEMWDLQKAFLDFLEGHWNEPDEGLWEVRGPKRHFTHSKVMAWVAMDRAIKDAERFGLAGDLDRWRALRRAIHDDVCRNGWNADRNMFAQYYGATETDAALLMMPLVGFLPCDDPRVRETVAAIERELLEDGLVHRYRNSVEVDGLPSGEGAFLACSFWYADVLEMMGRRDEALGVFEHLLSLRNDVGLLAEEFDPRLGRRLGNFPQAFSHVSLVNTAHNLTSSGGPAHRRGQDD